MKTSILNKITFIALAILCYSFTTHAVEQNRQWDVITLSFTSSKTYQNPYLEIPMAVGNDLLKVTFTGISGDAKGKSYVLTGFWNEKREWKVNFAAPFCGRWSYVTSSTDRGLNGKKGNFEVIPWSEDEKKSNAVRRGFVRVKQNGPFPGHYFEYSDGKPFLWVGDTWWNWTNKRIYLETFKKLVDDRSEKGFNVGQLFVPGNGWGRTSSLLDDTYTVLDTEHASKVEEMIKYANSKGITVWIHAWWSREDLPNRIGADKMQRWWRYLVHRFAAYNVVWVIGGEYNMHNNAGFPLDFWKNLGQMVKDEDPYERIVGIHNTPPFWQGGAEAPQWGTGSVLHAEPWLDYNQSQTGHGRYANEMIPWVVSEEYAREPAKPIVVTEPWYEFIEGNPSGLDIRFAAWSAIMSGAAGHTYGGGHVWLASVPEAPGGGGSWPYEKGFERTTYDYEGAVSMKYLAAFFKDTEWWNMSPRPDLLKDTPQPLCLANPGKEYILYLRYGGIVTLEMDPEAASYSYVYRWFEPGTGKYHNERKVSGKEKLQFTCPESYPAHLELKDFVLHVKRAD